MCQRPLAPHRFLKEMRSSVTCAHIYGRSVGVLLNVEHGAQMWTILILILMRSRHLLITSRIHTVSPPVRYCQSASPSSSWFTGGMAELTTELSKSLCGDWVFNDDWVSIDYLAHHRQLLCVRSADSSARGLGSIQHFEQRLCRSSVRDPDAESFHLLPTSYAHLPDFSIELILRDFFCDLSLCVAYRPMWINYVVKHHSTVN